MEADCEKCEEMGSPAALRSFSGGMSENGGEPTLVETGMAAVEKGDYQEALSSFDTAIADGKDLIRAYRGQAWLIWGLESMRRPCSFLTRLSETKEQQKETRKDILYYQAAAFYRWQNYEKTIETCGKILDISGEGTRSA